MQGEQRGRRANTRKEKHIIEGGKQRRAPKEKRGKNGYSPRSASDNTLGGGVVNGDGTGDTG